MTTFDRYDHLPEPIKQALAELEDFIGDLDGKTMGTEASDGEGFIDEGTVDADDAVKAFNVIVAALPAQERQDISTAVAAERERCATIVDAEAVFARENLDAIPDEAEADLGSRLTPRYYWNQRRALAEYYAKFIRSGAPMVAEDGTLIAEERGTK